ncbi:hypothetical protein E2C01_062164 [Portunus trituberculatus]|uniref:Uncharacterized protein n=1 Tax=Portunus trituberculatus TaxID=210409 RepID=A0A5B7HDB1_PORTR|nr:hypothetical protein [Portunus trituberculatus]
MGGGSCAPPPRWTPSGGTPRPRAARLSVSAALPGSTSRGRHAAFPWPLTVHCTLLRYSWAREGKAQARAYLHDQREGNVWPWSATPIQAGMGGWRVPDDQGWCRGG